MSCNIRACKGSAQSSSSRGLNWYGNIDKLAVLARDRAILKRRLSCLPITTHFFYGRHSSNPELIEPFVSGWGERYCKNVHYVKNYAIFEPPSMRACSSTPPKQNQDFVKEHNRTALTLTWGGFSGNCKRNILQNRNRNSLLKFTGHLVYIKSHEHFNVL